MSPHALRLRMRHGNVYPPDRSAMALERFFTEANLTAFRDLSLRFVAGRVDRELEDTIAACGAGVPPVGRPSQATATGPRRCTASAQIAPTPRQSYDSRRLP